MTCVESCDNTGVALPDYWSTFALYMYNNAGDWEFDAELLHDTTTFLVNEIRSELESLGDDNALELLTKIGDKMILSHIKVSQISKY